MKRWPAVLIVTLVAVGLSGIVLGARVPIGHMAMVSREYPVSVETLWTAVTDYAGYPIWRSGVDSVFALPDIDDNPAWTEVGRGGTLNMTIEESSAPFRFVTRIVGEEAFDGSWTFEMSETEDGSRLAMTEVGRIHSALFRLMSHYVTGYDRTMERFLDDLEVYLQTAVIPTRPADPTDSTDPVNPVNPVNPAEPAETAP